MIPLTIALSRLVPLLLLLRINPPWVWGLPAIALMTSQSIATVVALQTIRWSQLTAYWRLAEGCHLAAWALFVALQPDAPQPTGGLSHALFAFLGACLRPTLPGKREA